MINLLPQREKYSLAQARKIKQILVLGLMVLALLFAQGLILFAIKINLEGKLLFQETLLQAVRGELESHEEKTLEKEITLFLDAASGIDDFYKGRIMLMPILAKLDKVCPSTVQFESISYNASTGIVSITGFSPERRHLLVFKDKMEAEFVKVEFPSSNWVSSENIKFSVSFLFQDG